MFLKEGTHADVYYVAANENEVGVLGVNEVYPFSELGATVVVAKVKVAEKHYLQALLAYSLFVFSSMGTLTLS